jgi:hypothetical protein
MSFKETTGEVSVIFPNTKLEELLNWVGEKVVN